jgi:hypothetical protein
MQVLLFSMPDSFEHTPSLAMRMPNGALGSIAGNIDAHHRVAIADLILAQARVPETVARLVQELRPDVVGLSVMTFQRKTARQVVSLVRSLHPSAFIVVGGCDPASRLRSMRIGVGHRRDRSRGRRHHDARTAARANRGRSTASPVCRSGADRRLCAMRTGMSAGSMAT